MIEKKYKHIITFQCNKGGIAQLIKHSQFSNNTILKQTEFDEIIKQLDSNFDEFDKNIYTIVGYLKLQQ